MDALDQFVSSITAGGGRYALFAGMCFLALYVAGGARQLPSKIQPVWPARSDVWREIGFSVSSVLVFAVVETVLFTSPWVAEHGALYMDPAEYGWIWFVAAFPVLFIVHDAYFYWTHRMMHLPVLYPHVHAVHHRSTNPTPFSAYAVHPVEAFVNVGVFVVIVMLVPCHPVHLLVFALGMVAHNVYGHTGFELYPTNLQRIPGLRRINTSVAHNLHHQDGRYHFAFYFTFWDMLMGTMRPDYVAQYDEVSARRRLAAGEAPAEEVKATP